MPSDGFCSADKNRASEYRERAAEARSKAEALTDVHARKVMVEAADNWDRMADFEENKMLNGQADHPQ